MGRKDSSGFKKPKPSSAGSSDYYFYLHKVMRSYWVNVIHQRLDFYKKSSSHDLHGEFENFLGLNTYKHPTAEDQNSVFVYISNYFLCVVLISESVICGL